MQNPWTTLKKVKNEYVAECDKAVIAEYQEKLRGEYQLQLDGIPGPYTGNPEKSVVYVLALNPGHKAGEEEIYRKNQKYLIKNLTHENKEWPFISVSPVFENTPGGKWWAGKLKSLVEAVGRETVARFVFNAEYFPYHSTKYKPRAMILPSQSYTFSLVKKAVKDKKLIVIMRSPKLWYEAVPELEKYANKIVLCNPRNVTISKGNMDETFFTKIVDALRKTAQKAGLKPDA